MHELFPLPRSLTGAGVRETLAALARELPLEIVETPTGTPVFDWVVPREWKLRGAWIDGPDGRVVDAADSPLHVLGYSTPVDAVVSLEELRSHVHTHRDDPDLVPYRTSYWEEQWGLCMSSRQLDAAPGRGLPRRRRRDARGRIADLGRGHGSRHGRRRVPAQHLRLPPGARKRQPVGHRRPLGARPCAPAPAAARAHLPAALEPRDARPALLARPEPRSPRSHPKRSGRVVRRRPGPAALQAQPTR